MGETHLLVMPRITSLPMILLETPKLLMNLRISELNPSPAMTPASSTMTVVLKLKTIQETIALTIQATWVTTTVLSKTSTAKRAIVWWLFLQCHTLRRQTMPSFVIFHRKIAATFGEAVMAARAQCQGLMEVVVTTTKILPTPDTQILLGTPVPTAALSILALFQGIPASQGKAPSPIIGMIQEKVALLTTIPAMTTVDIIVGTMTTPLTPMRSAIPTPPTY
mmetsp:Transcript_10712/g.21693  ORF Transcript_10712/g.21693 Transcript_10712/m.21693 type:complete len:222 (-) Transcript_10712:2612-3277(-)